MNLGLYPHLGERGRSAQEVTVQNSPSAMRSASRPTEWNFLTWIVVLLWVAFAFHANFSWPIDRTKLLRQFKEIETRQPELAGAIRNIPIGIRSGYPVSYIVRDENSNLISYSINSLYFNLFFCLVATVAAVVVSRKYIYRYNVRFLFIATSIVAMGLAMDQFGYGLWRVLFALPVFVVAANFIRALLIKQTCRTMRCTEDA